MITTRMLDALHLRFSHGDFLTTKDVVRICGISSATDAIRLFEERFGIKITKQRLPKKCSDSSRFVYYIARREKA